MNNLISLYIKSIFLALQAKKSILNKNIENKQNTSGGDFLLFCELDKIKEMTDYVISVYSSEEVDIEEIPIIIDSIKVLGNPSKSEDKTKNSASFISL